MIGWTIFVLVLALLPAETVRAIEVHNFDCKNCHKLGVSYNELGNSTTNVCLECHKDNPPSVTMLDGFSATPTGVFAPTDASNVMGSYPTGLAEGSGSRSQSSHIWAARDVNEAAGAKAPSNRYFYGRYGISTGKVTCQRCHDPHSRDATNTKILRLGTGSREQMCIDCHAPWNIDNTDHGLLSHPMVADYAAVQGAVANEGKYRAPADVATQGGEVVLVDGKVSCSSCHGVHFTDSDGTTLDGPGQTLSAGDGKLLKADGPAGNDKSMLCQACHTYKAHGSTNETVGCLVCHSGHAYNGGNPNYYVLRGQTETTTYGAVNSLAYTDLTADLGGTSTTAQLWAGSAGSADGYCERCHGDLTSMPGSSRTHVEGEDCLECHAHNGDGMTYAFEANCTDCHGWPPSADSGGGPEGYAFVDAPEPEGRNYSQDADYKPESTTAHTTHTGSTSDYGLSCGSCHDDDFGATHNDGNNQNVFTGSSPHVVSGAGGVLRPVYDKTGAGTCSSVYCHSNGGKRNASGTKQAADFNTVAVTWTGESITSCAACHGNDSVAMGTSNNSPRHIPHLDRGYSCNICHQATAASATALAAGAAGGSHVDGEVDIVFDSSYSLGAGLMGSGSYDAVAGTCAVYCHSDGKGNYASADWDLASGGACDFCHGHDAGSANPLTSGSHATHIDDSDNEIGRSLGCVECHSNTVSDNNTIGTAANHIDGAFTLGIRMDGNKSDCTNIYCHSNGNAGNLVYRDRAWGSAPIFCDGCHGDGNGKAYPAYANGGIGHVDANSHEAHAGNAGFNCAECHSTTATGNGLKTGGTLTHLNETIDVSGPQFAWDPATGTCSNIACHFDNGAKWGDTLTCTSCHNNGTDDGNLVNAVPAASSAIHAIHYNAAATYVGGCDGCHGGGASTGSHAGHADLSRTLVNLTYSDVDKNCTNACHLAAPVNLWSAGQSLACSDCHGSGKSLDSGDNPPSSGSHAAHVVSAAGAYGSTANSSTADTYDFGCGKCHGSDDINHIDGTLTVVDVGWTGTVCNQSYCHSNGAYDNGDPATTRREYVASPQWLGGTFSGDRCAACHLNSPDTGAHHEHEVGFHYDAVYSGLAGFLPVLDTDPVPAGLTYTVLSEVRGHGGRLDDGITSTSTVLSCQVCHNATVTVWYNDNNTTCAACHVGGAAPPKGQMTIADKSRHVNGVRDVQFFNQKVRSKAQLSDMVPDLPGPNVDWTEILELQQSWVRINGYKAADGSSYDESPDTLLSTGLFDNGTGEIGGDVANPTCLVSCHLTNKFISDNNLDKEPVGWFDGGRMCIDCHTRLPR
ncbi:CxxxxCH/CxxCH domain c-type cytochrome [Geoalkalibacter subterraneus]|nr:CxxxxCH/CxxCH domain-containing protein [Geoalkalibacter subterraneus]